MRHVNSITGVESAALATNFPFNRGGIANGPNSTSFEIEGQPAQHEFEGPWTVYKGGTMIGRASAFVFSPTLVKNIGLAMLKIEHTTPGERIEVQRLPGEPRHQATVVTLPFIDPKKAIPKRRLDAS